MGASPVRIRNARTRRGDKNYKRFSDFIIYKAVDLALERQGMPRHMTEERRWGKHIKNAEMLDRNTYQKGFEETLAELLNDHIDKEPDIFLNDRESRDKVFLKFEKDITVLRQYPRVINAMWTTLGDSVPTKL